MKRRDEICLADLGDVTEFCFTAEPWKGGDIYLIRDVPSGRIIWSAAAELRGELRDERGSAGDGELPWSIHFRPDGLEVYLVDTTNGDERRYTLTSPWRLDTAREAS